MHVAFRDAGGSHHGLVTYQTSPGGGVVLIGPNGEEITVGGGLTPDATGTLAGRSAHDAAAIGFVYLATDQTPQEYYIREGVSGWSAAIPAAGGAAPAPTPDNSKELTFEMFGCTGVGNERVAITAALNYAATSGKPIVDHSGKTFSFEPSITITAPNSTLSIAGNITLQGTGPAYLNVRGALTEVATISAAAVKGAYAVSVTDNTFAPGDIAVFWNSREYSFSLHRPVYFDGEFAIVKGVSGSTVLLQSALRTSYTGEIADKALKLSPVTLLLKGISVRSGNAAYALNLQYAANSRIYAKDILSTGYKCALSVDKCYDTDIIRGSFSVPYNVATTTGYGISISNSQKGLVENVNSFGGRHAVATGGTGAPGSVPVRDFIIRKSVLDNDPASATHTADFHGNTENSYFDDCDISGWVALGGKNTGVRGGKVGGRSGSNKPVLGITELVGGTMTFSCEATVPAGSTTTAAVGFISGSFNDFINEPFKIELKGATVNVIASVTRVVLAYIRSVQPGTWVVDGLTLKGDTSGLASIVRDYYESPGVDIASVVVRGISHPDIPPLSGRAQTLAVLALTDTSSGAGANGSFTKYPDGSMICRHSFSGSAAIETGLLGAFKSADFSWTYPAAFNSAPFVSVTPTGGTAVSGGLGTVSTTAAAFFVTANAEQVAATRTVNLVAIGRWRA